MTVVSMSAKEFSRLDVLMDLEARRITVRDACGLLRLKRRQVFRLLKDFRQHGAASLVSKRRGKPGVARRANLRVRRRPDLRDVASG